MFVSWGWTTNVWILDNHCFAGGCCYFLVPVSPTNQWVNQDLYFLNRHIIIIIVHCQIQLRGPSGVQPNSLVSKLCLTLVSAQAGKKPFASSVNDAWPTKVFCQTVITQVYFSYSLTLNMELLVGWRDLWWLEVRSDTNQSHTEPHTTRTVCVISQSGVICRVSWSIWKKKLFASRS